MIARSTPLRDPELPQLDQVMNPYRMAREFELHLFAPGVVDDNAPARPFRVRRCEIGRVKYKRGFRCTIGYRLSIQDRRTGEIHEHLLSGRLYKAGESRAHFERARRQPLIQPAFGQPVFHLDALSLVVWAFPNDRKLPGLSVITNPAVLRNELLPPVLLEHCGPDWTIDALDHSIASYVPEGRCCVRVELLLRHRQQGKLRRWTLFGKAHCSDRGERGYTTLQQLWGCGPAVGIPRPLAYQAEHRLFWQEAVAGQPLAHLVMDEAMLNLAAHAVASLHRTPYKGAYRITMADVAGALENTQTQLAYALPSGRRMLSATVRRMLAQVGALNSAVAATIHRDLHPHNILIDRDRANLIDLDDVCIGPPLHDLGSFIARILYQALRDQTPQPIARRIIDSFVRGYRTLVPWPVRSREIAWYTAVALINERVFRRVTHLDAEQPAILQQVIELADELTRGTADTLEFNAHG